MKVEARLTFDTVRHDQDTDAHLVLTVTAPPIEAQTKRPPLCLIPLIDVSPSMFDYGGRSRDGLMKIDYAKRSVDKLIEHLGPGDYCGLVSFSGDAQVLQRPTKITAESKAELKRKVAGLQSGSATNIADALLQGLDLGNKADLPGSVIVRVILFTDGQANRGPETTSAGLIRLLEANLGSCTASAFGYGSDADQNLLGELAKKGSGNYAFVQNPDDALTAFGKELGGLLSTYATNLLINVSASGDNEITDVISDVDSEEEKIGQGVRIKIPDILAEEVRHIVLGVKVKAQKAEVHKAVPRPLTAFTAKAGWDILDVNSKKQREGGEARAKVQFVKEGEEQKAPTPALNQIVGLAQVVRAQLEAEEKAKKGDFSGAVQHLQAAAAGFNVTGNSQAAHLAHQLSAKIGSAQAYAQNGGYLRSVSGGGTRGYGVASYDASAQADLMAAGVVSFANSSQTSSSQAFTGAIQADPLVAPPVVINPFDPGGGFPMGGAPLMPPPDGGILGGQGFVPPADGGILGGAFTVGVGGAGISGSIVHSVVPLGAAPSLTGSFPQGHGVSLLAHASQHVAPPLPRTDSEDASKASKSKKSKLSKKSKSW